MDSDRTPPTFTGAGQPKQQPEDVATIRARQHAREVILACDRHRGAILDARSRLDDIGLTAAATHLTAALNTMRMEFAAAVETLREDGDELPADAKALLGL